MVRALFSLQRESAGARLLARSVLATWLLPLFFALIASFAAPSAQAQVGPVQTVVVLDFAVAKGLDPLLGRKAADGLAVELQRSGEYDVVPRQRVEEAVAQQAGLQPPFNDTAQIQLATAVNANSVFSGRVERVDVDPGRSARVTIEARQLDILTGDYINGTVVSEPAEQKLGEVASEILVDEAINKAVFRAVRSMRQITLPAGVVLNTARDSVELSIGAQRGVVPGQRYTVLRDIQVPGSATVERRKIGEVTILRVGSDQSTARITAGGQLGVDTGDRVRQIFEPGRYPTTAARGSSSVSPVTAPPQRAQSDGGFLKKSGQGLLGLVGLAALVAFAGFGGNDGNSNPPTAQTVTEANPTQPRPQPVIRFTAGFTGINFSQTLDRESVVAYLVYRGTAPGFAADISNLVAVIDATSDPANKVITYTDAGVVGNSLGRRATFTSVTTTDSANSSVATSFTDGGTTGGTGGTGGVIGGVVGNGSIISTDTTLTINYVQRPLQIGQTYYYRVGRVTAFRSRTTTGTGNNTPGNNNNNTTGITQVTLRPLQSPVSESVGGYTPLFLPRIVSTSSNTDNFSVRIDTDFSQFTSGLGSVIVDATGNQVITGDFGDAFAYSLPPNPNVTTGVTQFRFEVSTTTSFSRNATFVSPDINPPSANGLFTEVNLDLGNASNIRIPSTPNNPYIPGVTPLYVRVLAFNSNDSNPTPRISRTFTVQNAQGLDRTATSSRFLNAPGGGAGQGINIGAGNNAARTAGGGSSNPRVLAPR